MQTLTEMQDHMRAVRDTVLDILQHHEEEAHDGEPCLSNRLSALAYLAHSLGVKGTTLNLFNLGVLINRYDTLCPLRTCPAHPPGTPPGA